MSQYSRSSIILRRRRGRGKKEDSVGLWAFNSIGDRRQSENVRMAAGYSYVLAVLADTLFMLYKGQAIRDARRNL